MGNERDQQAGLEDCYKCGGYVGGQHYPGCPAQPPPTLTPKAHCSCGATSGVKGKPHAKGCPNHPAKPLLRCGHCGETPGVYPDCEHCGGGRFRAATGQDTLDAAKARPHIEGCICGMDERDPKARHSDECWRAATIRVVAGERYHPSFVPVELECPECRNRWSRSENEGHKPGCSRWASKTLKETAQERVEEQESRKVWREAAMREDHAFLRAPEAGALTGIRPEVKREAGADSWRCTTCDVSRGHADWCPEAEALREGFRDGLEAAKERLVQEGAGKEVRSTKEHPEHAAADAFWAYWKENGETHKHGYYESTWGALRAAIKVAPDSFLLDHAVQRGVTEASAENFRRVEAAAHSPCPECGSGPGQYHTLKCGRFDEGTEVGSIYGLSRTPGRPKPQTCGECGRPESWEFPSWSICPCGKPAPPGGDTRTNVYRGDELLEVRYPHPDGSQCCWTREVKR